MASLSLAVNLILYFMFVMHIDLAEASNLLTNYMGTSYMVAVLISNVPEGIGASADLLAAGRSRWWVSRIWLVVVVASAVAAGLGYALLRDAPMELVATAETFAAGAIIAMLAESMIPEAYEQGGRAVGLVTAFGFAVSALLSFST